MKLLEMWPEIVNGRKFAKDKVTQCFKYIKQGPDQTPVIKEYRVYEDASIEPVSICYKFSASDIDRDDWYFIQPVMYLEDALKQARQGETIKNTITGDGFAPRGDGKMIHSTSTNYAGAHWAPVIHQTDWETKCWVVEDD